MHRCFNNYHSGMLFNACAGCVKMCHELDNLLNSHFVTLFLSPRITKASKRTILEQNFGLFQTLEVTLFFPPNHAGEAQKVTGPLFVISRCHHVKKRWRIIIRL